MVTMAARAVGRHCVTVSIQFAAGLSYQRPMTDETLLLGPTLLFDGTPSTEGWQEAVRCTTKDGKKTCTCDDDEVCNAAGANVVNLVMAGVGVVVALIAAF